MNINEAGILAAVFLGNIGVIFGAYISMKVSITRLEVLVDTLNRDINNIGKALREIKQKQEE